MNFLEKLDFMMEKHSLNKNTLSKACNIPYTTIDNWYKRGYEGLKLATVRKIATFFDTTLDYWFLDDVTDENYGKSSGFKVSYNEMKHIEKYRTLDTYGQETVDMILDREVQRMDQLKEEPFTYIAPEGQPNLRTLQYYRRIASAGTGQVVFEDMPTERIDIPDIPEYRCVSYAIGVNGDSMEPLYYDGDILLIETTLQIEVGEIGIFIVDGEAFVKQLGEGKLVSLNDKYKDIPLTEYSNCMGRVVGKLEEQ